MPSKMVTLKQFTVSVRTELREDIERRTGGRVSPGVIQEIVLNPDGHAIIERHFGKGNSAALCATELIMPQNSGIRFEQK